MPSRQFVMTKHLTVDILGVEMSLTGLLLVGGQNFGQSKEGSLKLFQFFPALDVLLQMTGYQLQLVWQSERSVRTRIFDDQDELEGRVALKLFRRLGNLLNRDVVIGSPIHDGQNTKLPSRQIIHKAVFLIVCCTLLLKMSFISLYLFHKIFVLEWITVEE